jgi:cephalosporin hydroxylase
MISRKMFSHLFHKKKTDKEEKSAASYADPVVNEHCSEFEVNDWILSEFVVRQIVPVVGVHPFPLGEIMLMVAAVCRFKPTHIFEWGTHIGKSARIFYETISHFRISTQIHSIDLPEDVDRVEHPHEQRGMLVRDIPEVRLHLGDGLTTSMEILSMVSAPVDPLFFLDGDHGYESVRHELEAILARFPGAAILVHDTFYQSKGSGYNVGPHQAIEDILSSSSDRYKKMQTETGLPGMTLLYPLHKVTPW